MCGIPPSTSGARDCNCVTPAKRLPKSEEWLPFAKCLLVHWRALSEAVYLYRPGVGFLERKVTTFFGPPALFASPVFFTLRLRLS